MSMMFSSTATMCYKVVTTINIYNEFGWGRPGALISIQTFLEQTITVFIAKVILFTYCIFHFTVKIYLFSTKLLNTSLFPIDPSVALVLNWIGCWFHGIESNGNFDYLGDLMNNVVIWQALFDLDWLLLMNLTLFYLSDSTFLEGTGM